MATEMQDKGEQQNLEQLLGGVADLTRNIRDTVGLPSDLVEGDATSPKAHSLVSDLQSCIYTADAIAKSLNEVLRELRAAYELIRPTGGPPF